MFTETITFYIAKDLVMQMLPESIRQSAVQNLVHITSMRVVEALKSEVPGEKRLEFEKLSERNDPAKIEAFLQSNVPHFAEIVAAVTREQLEEFAHALRRSEVTSLST